MKKVLIGVVGVVAIIVVAAFAVLWLVDWNSYVAKAVREATGRELRIGGDLRLSLLPNIEFSASDVRLSNAPGMAPAEMVSVGAVRVKLKLWPLLRRRVMIDTFVIRQPSVFLEVNKAGQPNWAFKDKDTSVSAEEPVEAPAERRGVLPINDLRLGDVRVEQGLVSYVDATTGQKLWAKDINLTVTLLDLGSLLSLTGKLTLNDKPITVDISVDSLRGALSGKRFVAKGAVSSKLVSARYDGSAQQKPVPGLDGKFSLDVPSVGKLAAWLDQPLDSTQPDPGPIKVRATFAADGAKVALKEATIEGKALKAEVTGSFDGSKPVAAFKANIEVEEMDLNPYLPNQKPKKGKGATAKRKVTAKRKRGWSEEPFDLTALSKLNGDVHIKIGSARYRDLVVQQGSIAVALAGGVLKTSIDELKLADGAIGASATLDASGNTAALDYQVSVADVRARPLLQAFADTGLLSGKAEFQARGKARGRNQKELVGSLNGDGQFKFLDGAIHGINLAAALRKAKTLGLETGASETQKTDFTELSGSFVITDGLLDNRDFNMLAPVIRLTGEGIVALPPQTIDYRVVAKMVASLKGQGGQDALAGLPIPIKVQGPWDNLAYKVDWKSVFSDAAMDPERLKNMPEDLRQMGKNFGVDMPISEIPGTGKLSDVIKSIPGLSEGKDAKKTSPGASEPSEVGSSVEQLKKLIPGTEASTEETKQEETPTAADPLKTLKGLFGK